MIYSSFKINYNYQQNYELYNYIKNIYTTPIYKWKVPVEFVTI